MLFALTGEVQSGKTRWLVRLVVRLAEAGVRCAGVVAPGVWRAADGAGSGGFEKLGIDNVLLPSGERIAFARRADLARKEGRYDASSQAGRAGLGWAIDDGAIARVNAHFLELAREAEGRALHPGLLAVDELGRLELVRGEGLIAAMGLLDRGPTEAFPHALAVVRADLLPLAQERFRPVWGEPVSLAPDDAGAEAVLRAFRAR